MTIDTDLRGGNRNREWKEELKLDLRKKNKLEFLFSLYFFYVIHITFHFFLMSLPTKLCLRRQFA
jgi:hypothetical protein